MSRLLKTFVANFAAAFSGRYLIFHGIAIGLTAVLVLSGFDWWYFTAHKLPVVYIILFPAMIIGMFFPLILPITMYLAGKFGKQKRILCTAFAVAQAVILGSLISSIYKAFTGRIQPDFMNMTTDISHNFQFGFLQHGIFWGWPSSHTTIAFAMAFTIIFLYRGNKGVLFGALLYAFYIGLGVSLSIHWFSDFVAGALIGTAIGMTVGKSYRDSSEF
ncbi:MAG: phosphatase PAP2 family protein [Gammaproteobacteria bacterium]|nr:phosphatase PAP2 family protein [Gammaproteobacteria bacterium]